MYSVSFVLCVRILTLKSFCLLTDPPAIPTDNLSGYKYPVFDKVTITCLETSKLDRRTFLSNYEDEEGKLAEKIDVKTEVNLGLQSTIFDMRTEKKKLEDQVSEKERAIDTKVGELAKNDSAKQTDVEAKNLLDTTWHVRK